MRGAGLGATVACQPGRSGPSHRTAASGFHGRSVAHRGLGFHGRSPRSPDGFGRQGRSVPPPAVLAARACRRWPGPAWAATGDRPARLAGGRAARGSGLGCHGRRGAPGPRSSPVRSSRGRRSAGPPRSSGPRAPGFLSFLKRSRGSRCAPPGRHSLPRRSGGPPTPARSARFFRRFPQAPALEPLQHRVGLFGTQPFERRQQFLALARPKGGRRHRR